MRQQPRDVAPRSLLNGSFAALGIAVVLLIVQSVLSASGEAVFSGPEAETWAAAAAQVILGAAMLAVLGRLGWSRLAAVTTRWQPGGLAPSIPIIMGCLISAVGLLSTSWEPAGKIVALGLDYLATGFYEELAFRGLIFVFLALTWQHQPKSLVWAAAVSGLIFGIVHLNPILLVVGPLFGLAFTRLQLDIRTIWLSMLLHAAFDWLTEFPFDDAGNGGDSWGKSVAAIAVVVAGLTSFAALRKRTDTLPEAMDTVTE